MAGPHPARHRIALAAAALCSPVLAAQCPVPLAPGEPAARIVSLTGRGESRPAEAQPWSAAYRAQQLQPGADLRTLASSTAAVLLVDRTQIRMAAGSQLRLCEAQPTGTVLELAVGRLWARTRKSPATLQLRMPAAVAGIRGTDWDVEVDPLGRTTLTVLSGVVDLSNEHGQVELAAGEQGFAAPGQAPVKRVLVRPRDRVQWVMAHRIDVARLAEFQGPGVDPALQAVQEAIAAGQLARARELLLPLRGAAVDLLLADLDVVRLDLDGAEQRLARSWEQHRDARLAARRAELLLALDRAADAREGLDAALQLQPRSPELLLADAQWLRLEGRPREALARFREAVAAARTPLQRAAAHAGLGRALQERGDLHAGREALASAVRLAPQDASYRGDAATAAAQAMRLREARAGFDAALALAGDDYVSLAGSGLLSLQQGDAEAARQALLAALMLEPRYARGQVWLAEAEYTLGQRDAALDSLARARIADPRDPLPWQVQAIVLNDSGEPLGAIDASREALQRLPFLKSLNQLATDSQGSANLGKALGDFGLEHWARAYASASYYPLWAGSHFFLADRYESDFSRRSELFQGYLSDPTVFGASEKRSPLVAITGTEWSAGVGLERNALRRSGSFDVGHRGFHADAVPLAWLVRATDVEMQPRDGPPATQYRMASPGLDLALGARPNDRLGLFFTYAGAELRTRFPRGLDLGNGITFNRLMQTHNERADAGVSLRWSADSQTWIKLHRGRLDTQLVLDDAQFGPQDYDYVGRERGLMLRHTVMAGEHRYSAGWERIDRDTRSVISDPQIATPRLNTERYSMPWLAAEWRAGRWSWMAEAYRPRFAAAQLDRFADTASGEDLLEPIGSAAAVASRVLPRFGLRRDFGPGRALHFAYQESVRAPGTHTLSPVATGAIPIDHHYQLPGSFVRKKAVQLDWEATPRTFLGAALSTQRIVNLVAGSSGRLYAQNTGALFDNVTTLAPVALNAQVSLDTYQETPVFSEGRVTQARAAWNQILAPRWSLLTSYTHARSRNTGDTFEGNVLPGFPRHTLLAQTTWRHQARSFSLLAATWRSERFRDEANALRRPAGWSLGLAHAWESADRRWRVSASVQRELTSGEEPVLYLLVRWRD